MPGDETLLDLFLFYFLLRLITETVTATNANAVTVAWPRDRPWKHLKVGEWMRWLGLWVLMTLYPITGSRRLYWRGSLTFGRYMPERSFEAILRAFALSHEAAKPFSELLRYHMKWLKCLLITSPVWALLTTKVGGARAGQA